MTGQEASPFAPSSLEAIEGFEAFIDLQTALDILGYDDEDGVAEDIKQVQFAVSDDFLRHQYDPLVPVVDEIARKARMMRAIGANTNTEILRLSTAHRRYDTNVLANEFNERLERRAGWFGVVYSELETGEERQGILASLELAWLPDRRERGAYCFLTETGDKFRIIHSIFLLIEHLPAEQQATIHAHRQSEKSEFRSGEHSGPEEE